MHLGSLSLNKTNFAGLFVSDCKPFSDCRGEFFRCFCGDELAVAIGNRTIKQINHSRTLTVGAVRGLHFQFPPYAEMKLVRCLQGCVADVAVDLRRGSSTFLEWHLEELSAKNGRMMIIPEGFAHGFQVLEPNSKLLYLHTASYTPSSESAIRFDDPSLSIIWPLPITEVSDRDNNHALLSESFLGIDFATTENIV